MGTIQFLIYIIKLIDKMFNDREELKKWISGYIIERGKKSLHIAINNSKSIKEFIISQTNFLPENAKFNQRCYHIVNDLYEIPMCKECNLNVVNFNNRNKDWRYLDFCSSRCGRISKISQDKYKMTNKIKYGSDNYSKTNEFKERMVRINRSKHGVDWYQQSKDHREKSIITCLKKYGVDYYFQTEEFKNKVRSRCIDKYGVDWYSKSQEFNKKFKEASFLRYGVSHPMLNDEVKNKVSNTINELYGLGWYNLTTEFKEKSFISKELKYGNPITGFKVKEYNLPSGKVVKIQGYENFALDILLSKYEEDDLFISYYEIKEEIGILNYLMDDIDRIYIPDIYIKSENKIIEVKSEYTYNIEIDKNRLKREACIEIGLNFEFWIIDKSGKIIEVI